MEFYLVSWLVNIVLCRDGDPACSLYQVFLAVVRDNMQSQYIKSNLNVNLQFVAQHFQTNFVKQERLNCRRIV